MICQSKLTQQTGTPEGDESEEGRAVCARPSLA